MSDDAFVWRTTILVEPPSPSHEFVRDPFIGPR